MARFRYIDSVFEDDDKDKTPSQVAGQQQKKKYKHISNISFAEKKKDQPTSTPQPTPQPQKQEEKPNLFKRITSGVKDFLSKKKDPVTVTTPTLPEGVNVDFNRVDEEQYLKFPSIFPNPEIGKFDLTPATGKTSAALRPGAKDAAIKFWSAPVDNSINATRDFLTYHPELQQHLATAQKFVEETPYVGLKESPLSLGVTKSIAQTFLGSSRHIQDTFNTRLPRETKVENKTLETVGGVIGTVMSFVAGGSLLKAVGTAKATLPILFASLGQTSAGPDTTFEQRLKKLPVDTVAGWLFSYLPLPQGLKGSELVKTLSKGAGGAGTISASQTFINSLTEGMSKEEAAKLAANQAVIGALFYLGGTSINLLSNEIFNSKYKAGKGVFSPDQVKEIVKTSKLDGTAVGNNLIKTANQAATSGKNVEINMEAMQKTFVSKKLNLNKPEGINLEINLVDAPPGISPTDTKTSGIVPAITNKPEVTKPKPVVPPKPATAPSTRVMEPIAQEASKLQSADDFATLQGTSADKQIGAVPADQIVARDTVDKTTSDYKSLVESIKKDGIKEAVIVTVEDGKITTFEGSHRVTAAQEAGVEVPVIVTKGELPGLQTIQEFYNTSKDVVGPTGETGLPGPEGAKPSVSGTDITVFRGSQGKVKKLTKKFDKVLEIDTNQYELLQTLAKEGNTRAKEHIDSLPKGVKRVDFTIADPIIREAYKGKFNAIQYNNTQLPQIGREWHDLSANVFVAENQETAKQYAAQSRGKKKVVVKPKSVKSKPKSVKKPEVKAAKPPKKAVKKAKPKKVVKKKVPAKKFTPKSTIQPKLRPLKKADRKNLQIKTKDAVFSGVTQEENVKNVEKFMKDTLNRADSPTYEKELKVVRAELKRNMYELVGADTGHWKRDYAFFNKIRNNPEVSDVVNTLEDSIFQIDEIVNADAPPMMGGSLASTGSQTIDTFENRVKPKGGTEEFKLFKQTQKLTRKYAQSIGEGYLPRKSLGVYYQKTKNIRVNAINNLSVVAHEITHFLDYQYNISDKLLSVKGYTNNGKPIYDSKTSELRSEITDVYTKYYPGGKKTHSLRKRATEGFATLLQKYIELPTTIEKEFPLLVKSFLKPGGEYYKPVIKEIIVDLNKIVEGYQGLSSLDKIGSKVTSENPSIDKDSFLSFFDKVRTQLVDELYPIEVLAKKSNKDFTTQDPSLWLRAFNSVSGIINTNIASKKGYWSLRGNTFKKLHDFNWKTLVDITQERKVTDAFGFYLVARREHFAYKDLDKMAEKIDEAKQRLADDEKVLKETPKEELDLKNEDGFTVADEVKRSINRVKEAKFRHAEFKVILDRDGFSRKEVDIAYEENQERFKQEEKMFDILTHADLDFMASENVQLIKRSKAQNLKTKEGYASFKRQFYDEILGDNNEFPNISRVGNTKVSSFLKRKGSERTIINPLYSGMANHSEMMRKGLKQVVYNKITDIGVSAAFPNLFQEQQLKAIPDPKTGAILFPQEKDPNIIMGRKNYKRKPVLVDGEVKAILDSVLTYENIDVFQKLYVGLSRMFTAGTTAFYPQFAATNLTVDQITAMANTTNKYRPVYSALVQFKDILKDKTGTDYKYYEEYMVLGGERQTFTGWQKLPPDKLFKAINNEKKGLEKSISLMEKGTDVLSTPSKYSEIVTRATEYVRARKSGKPQIVALEEAGRVTAPFHHLGKWGGKGGSTFIRGLPFFNATLQVLDQSVRTVETTAGRKRTSAVLLMITAAYLASMVKLLRADDEQKEEYKDLHIRELTSFIYFPNPLGKNLLKVKMSQTFSPVGAIINMIIADEILGTNYSTKDYATAATAWLPDQFNPVDPIQAFLSWIPQVFSTGSETIFNVKTYPKVSPIESMGLRNLPPEMRTNENTSVFAKWLGEKAGLSPIKIDYLLTGYFGRAIGFATGKPSAYEFKSSVIRDYYFSGGRRVSGTYDIKEENDQNYTAYQRGAISLNKAEIDDLYRVKILTEDFADVMRDYRKVDIEEDQENAAELRNEAIQIINQIDNGDVPKGFKTWSTKAKKRRTEKIKDLKEEGLFEDGEKVSNDTFIDQVILYSEAIGTDPVTAFDRLLHLQKIDYINNDTIVVKRMPEEKSQRIKEKAGKKNKDYKLDHTIPRALGGSNNKSNLKIITTEQWEIYTSVEIKLIKELKDGYIDKKEAQKLITDYKSGKLTKKQVLDRIKR